MQHFPLNVCRECSVLAQQGVAHSDQRLGQLSGAPDLWETLLQIWAIQARPALAECLQSRPGTCALCAPALAAHLSLYHSQALPSASHHRHYCCQLSIRHVTPSACIDTPHNQHRYLQVLLYMIPRILFVARKLIRQTTIPGKSCKQNQDTVAQHVCKEGRFSQFFNRYPHMSAILLV